MSASRSIRPEPMRLDRNERLVPAPRLVELMSDAPGHTLNTYPSTRALEAAMAERFGVDPRRVLATAGGDDAIDRLCRLETGCGRSVVSVTPTFEMFPYFARLAGADWFGVPDLTDPLPPVATVDSMAERCGCVVAISPHNPTGVATPGERLASFAATLREGVRFVVDQAYVDFADDDPIEKLLALPGTVVIRTLSKAWGLAGARVGFAIGPLEIVDALRRSGPAFALAGPSVWLAERALELGDSLVRPYVERVRLERMALEAVLRALGGRTWPSQANFVLARFEDPTPIVAHLAAAGIRIRTFPRMPELIRITLPGDEPAFSTLRSALVTAPVARPHQGAVNV